MLTTKYGNCHFSNTFYLVGPLLKISYARALSRYPCPMKHFTQRSYALWNEPTIPTLTILCSCSKSPS